MKKFYMNYVEGKSAPTKKFLSFEEAENEARRLAKTSAGYNEKVFILAPVHVVYEQAPPVISEPFEEDKDECVQTSTSCESQGQAGQEVRQTGEQRLGSQSQEAINPVAES